MWNRNNNINQNEAEYRYYKYNLMNNNYWRNNDHNENDMYRHYEQLIDKGSPNNIADEITPMLKNKKAEQFLYYMFRLAIHEQPIDKIRVFLDAGVDINIPNGYMGESVVYDAIYTDNPEIVKLFLDNGGNIESLDAYGNTPLHKAVKAGKMNSLQLLLERGAKIDTENTDKLTPLMSAIIENNTDIVELLLKNPKLDINYQNIDGNTALHAALDVKNNDIALLLIKHGANLNLKNKAGETPIDILLQSMHAPAAALPEDDIVPAAALPEDDIVPAAALPDPASLASAMAASAWKRRRAAVLARAMPRRPAGAGAADKKPRKQTRRRSTRRNRRNSRRRSQ